METIELEINETNELSYEVMIEGVDNEKIDVKFVIETEQMEIGFNGEYKDGKMSVEIPSLSGVIEPKTYRGKMVFLIGENKYFEPLKVNVKFVQPISIDVQMKESMKKTIKPKEIKITENKDAVKVTKKNEKKTLLDRLDEVFSEIVNADNMDSLTKIYQEHVLMSESVDVDKKKMIEMLDLYSKEKHGVAFKEYIMSVKE